MQNQRFTGIGCFAKLDRLARIFSRLVHDYALGPIEGHDLFGKDRSTEIEGSTLLQALLEGRSASRRSGIYETVALQTLQEITGFYLSINDQKLSLSIFTRKNQSGQVIYTTGLDGLTQLRRKRMN